MNAPMTPHTIDTARRDEDFNARCSRIRAKILDGIEETLDELAQPDASRDATQREEVSNEVRRAVRAHCATLLCRRALCLRAKICRGKPCAAFRAIRSED